MLNQRKVGVMLSYMSMLINIAIGIISVPLMLHFISTDEYGVYELMGSFLAYMSVMDFGLSSTITRYYSKSMALNDEKGKENILAISSIIYLVIGILTVILGCFLYQSIDILYANQFGPALTLEAKKMFVLVVINMAITIPSHIFTAVITSHERFIFSRIVTMLSQALQPILYVAILMRYPSAMVIIAVQTFANIFVILINIFYCFSKLKIKIKLHKFDKSLISEMLGFSFFIFLAAIIDQLYWQTDKLILGAVVGATATGIYGLASRINTLYTNFSATVNSVFLPQITTICTKTSDMSEINKIFQKVGRIQFLVMSFILSGFICFGQQFIMIWAGSKFTYSEKLSAYYICLVVMIPLIIPLIQNIGITILQAKNKHAFRSIVYFIIAVMNVLLSIPLAKVYGGLGCAIATSFSMILGNIIIINIYYQKKIGLDVISFFKEILKLTPVMLICIIVGFALNMILPNSIFMYILKIVLFSLIFGVLSLKFSMNDYEKNLVLKPLSKITGKFRR